MTDNAGELTGRIEYKDRFLVKGYAVDLDQPDIRAQIEVVVNGKLRDVFTADVFRWDLKQQGIGDGCCGFVYPLSVSLGGPGASVVAFRWAGTGRLLEGSPVTVESSAEAGYIPFATTEMTGQRVLVLAPHPDDESLACGGALILHRDAGDPVKVAFLTDGSQGMGNSDRSPEAIVDLREAEARQAGTILGVDDLEFWRIPDRCLADDPDAAKRLASLLADYEPTLIYAPSPLEFHPDHRAAASLVWRAVQNCGADLRLAFYDYNRPVNVNTLVDISEVVDRKRQACEAYRSQQGQSPYADCAIALNRYRALTVSSACAYAEGYFVLQSPQVRSEPPEAFGRIQLLPKVSTGDHAMPLVSVIIRTKDRPALLREAISSVVTQSYAALQVVVVNDGGADVSDVVRQFDSVVDIRHIDHRVSRGRAAAANAGAAAADGVYLNFLDDDDLLYAEHVERLAGFLHASGEDFAYSDCEMGHYRWDGSGFSSVGAKRRYKGIDYDRDRLFLNNFIPMMTAMFARRLWEKCGGMDETLEVFEDWDLWLRMSDHALFHRLPAVTAEYRVFTVHDYDYLAWRKRIYEKHKNHWGIDRMVDWTWTFVASLEDRLAELNEVAASRHEKIMELYATNKRLMDEVEGLRMAQNSYAWKLARLPSRFLPRTVMEGAHRLMDVVSRKKR